MRTTGEALLPKPMRILYLLGGTRIRTINSEVNFQILDMHEENSKSRISNHEGSFKATFSYLHLLLSDQLFLQWISMSQENLQLMSGSKRGIAKNCIMRSFMVCTFNQILLEWSKSSQ